MHNGTGFLINRFIAPDGESVTVFGRRIDAFVEVLAGTTSSYYHGV